MIILLLDFVNYISDNEQNYLCIKAQFSLFVLVIFAYIWGV